MAEEVNVQSSIPQISSKQIHRQNVPTDSNRKFKVQSYFLRSIAISYFGNASVKLDERFSNVLKVCSCLL